MMKNIAPIRSKFTAMRAYLAEGLTEEERKNRGVRSGLVNALWKIIERAVDGEQLPYDVKQMARNPVLGGWSLRFAVTHHNREKNVGAEEAQMLLRPIQRLLKRADLEGVTAKLLTGRSNDAGGIGVVVRFFVPDEVLVAKGYASDDPEDGEFGVAEDVSKPITSQGSTKGTTPAHKQKALPGQEGYTGPDDEDEPAPEPELDEFGDPIDPTQSIKPPRAKR